MGTYVCGKCGRKMVRDGRTPGGKQRWCCSARDCRYTTTAPWQKTARTQAGVEIPRRAPVFQRPFKTERFLITAAQNATPVHAKFLASLKVAADYLGAELVVVPIRYKNPTSKWSESQANAEEWAAELTPYLFNVRRKLAPGLVLLGDVKTQPTASSPLTGFDALTHGESAILAHTKLQFRTVPTPQHRRAKILTTTGAVTVPNYTDSKTGALGAFHHTLGACLVESGKKSFHLRQINADKETGAFIDLATHYSPGGVSAAPPALALVMGDTHVDLIDPAVKEATFGDNGMVDLLNPKVLVYHDLLDGNAVNPHHVGNVFAALSKSLGARDRIEDEVGRAFDFLVGTSKGRDAVVVPSNHNDFLMRWIINTDWRQDPVNAWFYLRTAKKLVARLHRRAKGFGDLDPFVLLGEEMAPLARFLRRDDSFTVGGVELGMHGDRGPNGARGSIKNLRRIGVKSVIGHTHSPGIEEGCYQVGTSTRLRLDYNKGPSGWLNTHCVIYANGKRSLLSIINGEWRRS